jgi:hypothetical protein
VLLPDGSGAEGATAAYKDYEIGEASNQLAELGYDGVELCLEHPDTKMGKLTDDKKLQLPPETGQ